MSNWRVQDQHMGSQGHGAPNGGVLSDRANGNNPLVHLHLVSDSTGETLNAIARAASAQFDIRVREHSYALVRSQRQVERVVSEIRESPGPVLITIVSK